MSSPQLRFTSIRGERLSRTADGRSASRTSDPYVKIVCTNGEGSSLGEGQTTTVIFQCLSSPLLFNFDVARHICVALVQRNEHTGAHSCG